MNAELYKIVSGKYHVGLVGTIGEINKKSGLCLFYPLFGCPYRVCVQLNNLALLKKSEDPVV